MYLRSLFGRLRQWEPGRADEIRLFVGDRRACIILGEEAAAIHFEDKRLVVRKIMRNRETTLPYGITDRQTVLAILAGFLEVPDAITEGRLDLRGSTEDVIAMCAVIEVLVDSSTRIPALQLLARHFREDPLTGPQNPLEHRATINEVSDTEATMLRRYRLSD
jgi:hypothetical protein